jgi:hypothetical protein
MVRQEVLMKIDKWTPDTLPMMRLAQYLREFAILLGSEERVHFKAVKKGSACIAAFPEDQAAPKVKNRLEEIVAGSAPRPAMKAKDQIDDLLAEDNAIGHVDFAGARIIEFPGRMRPAQERIGPVRRHATIEGQIYQIGGKDETINIHLRGQEGDVKAEASIELARKLAKHLLLGRVRLLGAGEWYRVNGKWERINFTATDFIALDLQSLPDTIKEIQQVFHGLDPEEFVALMDELRHA